MKTVFLLWKGTYDSYVVGVFSSKDKAQQFVIDEALPKGCSLPMWDEHDRCRLLWEKDGVKYFSDWFITEEEVR